MDNWQVAQNYIVAAAIAGTVGGYYYYTSKQKQPNRTGSALTPRRSVTDLRSRQPAKSKPESVSRQDSTTAARKRKVKQEVTMSEPVEVRDAKPSKESDMSTAQFAQQMLQARQGANLNTGKSDKVRVKTVKPRLLPAHSAEPSVAGAEVEEEDIPEHTPAQAGDVADMLEPKPAAPTTLRITAPEKPQKERSPRQQKEQVVETKKQRQNRRKVEERKAQREEDEKERKVLEERQRRAAREARGEPAKNGLSKPPTSNPWDQRNASAAASVQAAAPVSHGAALLDTFDAESTSSSTGGLEASTAATSTTEEPHHGLSEDDQVAFAMQQSVDESGWTTVAPVKKATKKTSNNIAATSKTGIAQSTGAYAALEDSSE